MRERPAPLPLGAEQQVERDDPLQPPAVPRGRHPTVTARGVDLIPGDVNLEAGHVNLESGYVNLESGDVNLERTYRIVIV